MLAKKFIKKEVGFTLIELLVVIVIISILILFLFVSFTQVQKNSRDAQRKSDLQTIAAALQRFYSDNGRYPNEGTGSGACCTGTNGRFIIDYYDGNCLDTGTLIHTPIGNYFTTNSIDATHTLGITCGSKTYIKDLPKDPINTDKFEYCYNGPGGAMQTFELFAHMENPSNSNTGGNVDCNGSNNQAFNYKITAQD